VRGDRFTGTVLIAVAVLMLLVLVKWHSPGGVAEAQTAGTAGVFQAISSGDWRYIYVMDTRNGHLWLHNNQKPTQRWTDYGYPGAK
jgi:hypothetical protein